MKVFLFVSLLLLVACENGFNSGSKKSDDTDTPTVIDSTKVTRTVSNISELNSAVQEARDSGGYYKILLEDGEYQQSAMYVLDKPHIIIKGKSGDRSRVIVKGPNRNHMFLVRASFIRLENMTLGTAPGRESGFVEYHIIQVQGEKDADHFTLRNCRIIDATEQLLKVSKDPNSQISSDSGLVENCLFEFTTGKGLWWYTGGIDAHRSHNWIVRNNIFKNIHNPDPFDGNHSLTEGAIHFWADSRGTLVENNIIINCDRGIMFGLSSSGHFDGTIKNNFIVTNTDVGIYLGHAQNTKVYNNTVYLNSSYPNAIEYRFDDCINNDIRNNLCNGLIRSRNGGEADTSANITSAKESWFVDIAKGDLHLTSAIEEVVDKGEAIESITKDIDNESRSLIDIGADEWY